MAVDLRIKSSIMAMTPWLLSLAAVCALVLLLLISEGGGFKEKETVAVRKVNIALPPPPQPPPPISRQQQDVQSSGPSIDLLGAGRGPSLSYSPNPQLSVARIEQVDAPQFDTDNIDFNKTLSVSFPVLQVQELDQLPRLVSNNRISFPKELRRRGIKRVATKVEIIIDQNGKAFVKKIVDPVYPEMIEVIREAINDSRFTVPLKNGKPVQAIYLYNLVFVNRT